ncbi:MAG: FtsQ-type POTRA domain-containing protein, partial [Victivallales bacterium]|nr:FtsQ-type POTRA domain-containing protein [Victivallales bacterium]
MRKREKEKESSPDMDTLALDQNRNPPTALKLLLPLMALAVLALLALGARLGVKHLYRENPAFLLNHIDLVAPTAALRASAEECLRDQQVQEGMVTLTAIDLRSLRAELLRNPRVASAELQRVFPGTLRITIKPRVPVAILRFPPASGRGELKIDQEGYVLPNDLPGITGNLPRITGIAKPDNFVVGQ